MSGSPAHPLARAEAEFFRTLNSLIEPAVRAGCGSPGLIPTGLVVVETIGEKSGQPRRTPLVATVVDGCIFVSTIRGSRSQWVKNLRVEPSVRYWLAGQPHRGRARIFSAGFPAPDTTRLPPVARFIADGLLPPAVVLGWTFAVISGS